MFSVDDRTAVCDALLTTARADSNIAGAALVGSTANGWTDEWSDIDLALKLAPDTNFDDAVATWTTVMYASHDAVHHLDMHAGTVLYRVFLLADSLQVDLSFWPADQFRNTGSSFRLVFGEAGEPTRRVLPSTAHLAGMAWLYALHVRSALARGRWWQAVHMLDGMRDQVIALACLRHDLPETQGRGVDQLPATWIAALSATRAREVEPDDLNRAFAATADLLLAEVDRVEPALARRLTNPAAILTGRS